MATVRSNRKLLVNLYHTNDYHHILSHISIESCGHFQFNRLIHIELSLIYNVHWHTKVFPHFSKYLGSG